MTIPAQQQHKHSSIPSISAEPPAHSQNTIYCYMVEAPSQYDFKDFETSPLPEKKLKNLQTLFDTHDQDHDGFLSLYQVFSCAKEAGIKFSQREKFNIQKQFEKQGNSSVDFGEFLVMMFTKAKRDQSKRMKLIESLMEVFKVFDRDQDGFINQEDLFLSLSEMNEAMDKADVKKIVKAVGKESSGRINFQEFVKLMM
jgi:Ca2+-binding EF-hand superfamily protein